MANNSEKLLYDAAAMSPVRMLQAVAVSFGLAACGLTYWLLQAPSTVAPSSMAPLVVAGGMALAAIVSPIAALLYGRRIATRIFLLPDNATLRVVHTTLVGETDREIHLRDLSLQSATLGDSAGEQQFSPRRLEVGVQGGQDFVVVFNRGSMAQRKALVAALQGQSAPHT